MLHRGIQKSYIKRGENLSSPRGRIDISRLCGQGGITKDTLPCNYFDRDENNILNKTLLAGLKLGLRLVLEAGLKIKLQKLCFSLEENISDITLTRASLKSARNYAVSEIGYKTATILNPSLSDIPTCAKIDITDPVSCGNIASVILQPVNLKKVDELVSGDLEELRGYVMEIIS